VTDAREAPTQLDETPQLDEMDGFDQTELLLAEFRRQLEGQVSVPASLVQDLLLDLWAHLPEGDSRTEVERWLTETLERQLYSAADVDARLTSVLPRS
jgi:DNA-directed RNA polymerase specialized sigma24 family protein